MTLCNEATLVNQGHAGARAVTLFCNSWHCEICAPRRRSRLIAEVADGHPQRFLTLTTRRIEGRSPAKEAKFMAMSFRLLIQKIRRKWPNVNHQYFVVFEAHKSGWPHMHVALRGCYMPHAWIKASWKKLTGSDHVHIRAVDNPGRAGGYVAKYMGKDTEHFDTCKRYWKSGKWELNPPEEKDEPGFWSNVWEPRDMTRHELATMWEGMGWHLWEVDRTLYGGPEPPIGVKLLTSDEVYG